VLTKLSLLGGFVGRGCVPARSVRHMWKRLPARRPVLPTRPR